MKELFGNIRETTTTILMILLAVVVIYLAIKKPTVVDHSTSNTKTVTTEEIKTTQNTFSIEQVAVIKKALTDSLEKVYGSIIKRLRPNDLTLNPSPSQGEGNNEISDYSYVSEVDSNIVEKDSSGSITDMFQVKSTFISPVLLAENSVHLLRLNHTSFRKKISTSTQTSDTVYVKQSKSFWERFVISPNISAGYGLFNKQFDIYTGVGLSFEFNAVEIFSNKK